MSTTATALRKKHPRFIYESFMVDKSNADLKISFKFKIEPNVWFNPEITIENINQSKMNSLDEETINNLAFHLGLMEIPSYWKATCSSEILIKTGFLEKKQIIWWEDLLLNGMGQFFYTNKIDSTKPDFITFKIDSGAIKWKRYEKLLPSDKFLVLVSGGKDSVVTLQTLEEKKEKIGCLLLDPQKAALEIVNFFKLSSTIIVRRVIDAKLLELNRQGYLNGHTPFSAYLAFLGAVMAVFFNFGSVVVAHERSAEEENLIYLGRKINHQYSKTFRFEKLFAQYVKEYLAKNLAHFSLLRPLWEFQVAKLFTAHSQFFPIFRSCNPGQKTNSWCNQCPKCLSTFMLLYPFLKEKRLKQIFKKNLFEEAFFLPILKALIGKQEPKPFECVSTTKESLGALYLGWKKAQKKNHLPLLLQFFQKEVLPERNDWEKIVKEILTSWSDKHFVPVNLAKILKGKIKT
jgi:diphthamide synthase (EF-2-diphthine--ammonia ligase)